MKFLSNLKALVNNWQFIIMLCLTIGLLPFVPEPHIFGKIKWIAGGAEGMTLMDWGDALLHGFPLLLLIRLIVLTIHYVLFERNV